MSCEYLKSDVWKVGNGTHGEPNLGLGALSSSSPQNVEPPSLVVESLSYVVESLSPNVEFPSEMVEDPSSWLSRSLGEFPSPCFYAGLALDPTALRGIM